MCDDLKIDIGNSVAAFKRKCKNLLFKKYVVVDSLLIIYVKMCAYVILCI